MYGNGMNNPFMMPSNMSYTPYMGGPMISNTGMMGGRMINSPRRGLLSSLFGRGSARLDLGGLLNNASKALGVVNQAIPIVKEVGPMMNNMKSMLKIASIFKDETDNISTRNKTNINTTNNTSSNIKKEDNTSNIKENSTNINSTTTNEPNFFL